GRRVDVAVLDPQRIVLDADVRIARRQLAAELPVRGGAASVQQSAAASRKAPTQTAPRRRTSPDTLRSHAESAASRTDRLRRPHTSSTESHAPSTWLK